MLLFYQVYTHTHTHDGVFRQQEADKCTQLGGPDCFKNPYDNHNKPSDGTYLFLSTEHSRHRLSCLVLCSGATSFTS